MVKCLSHGLRGFNGTVQRRLATLMVTMLISSCWKLSSEVELRRIFDVCKRWADSGSHEFVMKNMVRYMRPHGRFAHCSCKNAVRQPPVLASCIEIYYFRIRCSAERYFSETSYSRTSFSRIFVRPNIIFPKYHLPKRNFPKIVWNRTSFLRTLCDLMNIYRVIQKTIRVTNQ